MSIYKPTPHVCPLVKSIEDQDKDAAIRENWIRMALQYLRVHCAKNPLDMFTAEEISKKAFEDCIPDPGSLRAWGPVFQRAKREGLIRQAVHHVTGHQYRSLTGSKHRSPLWEPAHEANA
jgi:hypothetical protein